MKDSVSASTQNQALNALLFLYRELLRQEIGELNAVRARRPKRVPLVLSRGEVFCLFDALDALRNDGAVRPRGHTKYHGLVPSAHRNIK